MSLPTELITPALDKWFGAVFIGTIVGSVVYGLTSHQTYRYFRLYPTDRRTFKFMVSLLWWALLWEVLRIGLLWDPGLWTLFTPFSRRTFGGFSVLSAVNCFDAFIPRSYYYLVTNYCSPETLLNGVWSLRLTVITTGVVIAITHAFFIRRIFLIGNRNFCLAIFLTLLLFVEMGFCTAATVATFKAVTFRQYIERFRWIIPSSLGTAVVIDTATTGSLIYYLHKCRTGFKRTDSMVDILMVYTINTGLLTGILNLVSTLTAIFSPATLIYYAINIVACKMYSNSLLAVLNSRRSILDRGLEGLETGSFGLKVPGHGERDSKLPPALHPSPPGHRNVIDVRVTTEMRFEVEKDDGELSLSSMAPREGDRKLRPLRPNC
ncbi:uncharacterized protein BXZ73DRAFT_101008 [Epithele typhae]|uniref:uncharacterized protein n=1 Tax=Epithele typhae TaxID=378194 RepID=UPI00200832AD|nr:uncharacterized protein BXZ73DRAFT_101008 [Epithele typhae]KAH9933623.1 hypothetical protein BXZ73DRAFT_101008 [Epithele typhae]